MSALSLGLPRKGLAYDNMGDGPALTYEMNCRALHPSRLGLVRTPARKITHARAPIRIA
jgi:hypothetical protein